MILKANVIATATGRIGYAVNFDPIAGLFYLKGGAAFVNYDTYSVNGQTSTISCLDAVFDPTTGCQSLSSPANIAVNFSAPSANRGAGQLA